MAGPGNWELFVLRDEREARGTSILLLSSFPVDFARPPDLEAL